MKKIIVKKKKVVSSAKEEQIDDMPNNAVELQDYLYDLWEDIMENDPSNKTKIALYNKGAAKYQKITGLYVMAEITDVKKQSKEFAAYKKKLLEPETKKELKQTMKMTPVKLGAEVRKTSDVKRVTKQQTGGKTQKQICIESYKAGISIEDCVAQNSLTLVNVKWYYRQIELGKIKI